MNGIRRNPTLGQRTRDDFENLSTILQHLNRMLSIIKFGPIKRIGLFLRGKTPQGEMSINLPTHTLEWFLRYFNMLSYHRMQHEAPITVKNISDLLFKSKLRKKTIGTAIDKVEKILQGYQNQRKL
ncbi:unnamed protein product [Fasciola hepatica]|uniref:Uncharacterized protein n=1 Tax=Fasciola hepatica TaxID=6192 RepID=A0ABC9HGG0_FASHE